MTDLKTFLFKLDKNLQTLQERQAKYGIDVPLSLVNQIDDHKKAIELTKQALTDDISEAEWRDQLKPLLIAIDDRSDQSDVAKSGVTIGDIEGGIHHSTFAGRDATTYNYYGEQRPLTKEALPDFDLQGQLEAHQEHLRSLTDPTAKEQTQAEINTLHDSLAALPSHEQTYCERVKAAYANPTFIELVSEARVKVDKIAAVADDLTDDLEWADSEADWAENGPADDTDWAGIDAFDDEVDIVPGLDEWHIEGQEIKRVRLNSLEEGIDQFSCIILLGDPGSGKTTALNNVAHHFANEYLAVGGKGNTQQLPLPLRLSEFGPDTTLEEFIINSWGGAVQTSQRRAKALAVNLYGYLQAGRLLILFDALNEMPAKGYNKRVQDLRHFIDQWSAEGNRFLVTCRVLDYDKELEGLQRVEVQPFNETQIKTFIQKNLTWKFRRRANNLIEAKKLDPAQRGAFVKHNRVKYGQRLWATLTRSNQANRRMMEMGRNPFLLDMMVSEFMASGGKLSDNRSELMQNFTKTLWQEAETKTPPEEWLAASVQRESLSVTAFEMQVRSGSGTAVETGLVKTVMPQQVQTDPNYPPRPAPADQILRLAVSASLIQMPQNKSSVRFYHQLLQEYFAARHLLKQKPTSLTERWQWDWFETEKPWVRPKGNYDPVPPPETTGWEETTILAAGLMPTNDDHLIRALIANNPVLAGRCLHEGQAKVNKETHQAVVDALLETISNSQGSLASPNSGRGGVGSSGRPAFGEIGDDRSRRILDGW